MDTPAPLAVVAVGGNALGGAGAPDAGWAAARSTAAQLARLVRDGVRLVVTHGNGPQVGDVLRRSELARPEVTPVSMDQAVAYTQGALGFMLARALADALDGSLDPAVVAVVTETVVDLDDPAFEDPTKPIGPFMSATEAERLASRERWDVRDLGTPGWRRVVASPRPIRIPQTRAIAALVESGCVVIAAGGGGIPVAAGPDGRLRGVSAVVDKDFASCLLAVSLGAEVFVIATAVDRVHLDYGTARERALERLTVTEARRHLAAGQFPAGSMGPKVQASVEYVEATGGRAIVTSLERIRRAYAGRAGTVVVADGPAGP